MKIKSRITQKIYNKDAELIEATFTRSKAIKIFCTQCMGFTTHPKDCTAKECPLYNWRGKVIFSSLK